MSAFEKSGREHSRDLQRGDRSNLVTESTARKSQLVIRLQVHPKFLGGSEVPSQANRRVSRDTPLTVHDLVGTA